MLMQRIIKKSTNVRRLSKEIINSPVIQLSYCNRQLLCVEFDSSPRNVMKKKNSPFSFFCLLVCWVGSPLPHSQSRFL